MVSRSPEWSGTLREPESQLLLKSLSSMTRDEIVISTRDVPKQCNTLLSTECL